MYIPTESRDFLDYNLHKQHKYQSAFIGRIYEVSYHTTKVVINYSRINLKITNRTLVFVKFKTIFRFALDTVHIACGEHPNTMEDICDATVKLNVYCPNIQ